MTVPRPVNKIVVCSECGLPWGEHGADPTLEKCVRLLKAELAKRPQVRFNQTGMSALSMASNPGIPFVGSV